MKSSVICIGDEILIGQIADTNSRFIAQRLNSLGIECSSIKIVGDDKKALVEVINEESKRSDLIIDFTVPKCTFEVLKIASKLKKKSCDRNHRFYKEG